MAAVGARNLRADCYGRATIDRMSTAASHVGASARPTAPSWSAAPWALGSGHGSWGGGLIHDWTHSYNPLIAFALVNVVLGLIPFLVALRR